MAHRAKSYRGTSRMAVLGGGAVPCERITPVRDPIDGKHIFQERRIRGPRNQFHTPPPKVNLDNSTFNWMSVFVQRRLIT